jgi:DNA mismatch endonuclease (patch repair protein)
LADVHTPEQRKRNMARIRATDTKPEMGVRRVLHANGFRYRLHAANLPGKPDLVFPRKKKAIFVHGCFWHSHTCRYGVVRPATNAQFWIAKRERTVERDSENIAALEQLGWDALIVWECELRDMVRLEARMVAFIQEGEMA